MVRTTLRFFLGAGKTRGADWPLVVRRVSAQYQRPFQQHASIGLCCALAQWPASGQQLEVWSHSQGIYNLRRDLALLWSGQRRGGTLLPVLFLDATHVALGEPPANGQPAAVVVYDVQAPQKPVVRLPQPHHLQVTALGRGTGGLMAPSGPLDFGNSGTGTRLMLGVIAGHDMRARVARGETVAIVDHSGEPTATLVRLRAVGASRKRALAEVAPLREADGRISGLVTCGVDVTERSQALADLGRSIGTDAPVPTCPA